MQSCGGKRSIYNGESKTKDGKSTLVKIIDNLFRSFLNNDPNTVLRHLGIKMKNMHTYENW